MLLLFIIILIIALGVILFQLFDKYYDTVFAIFGSIMLVVFAIGYLLVHISLWASASYRYKCLVAEREAIAMTLEHARSSENNIELAAITKDLCEFNSKLAEEKLNNSVFLLKDYVDDRVMDIKPIQ